MKKILLILIALIIAQGNFYNTAEAGFVTTQKARIAKEKEVKSAYNEVKEVVEKQINFSNKYNFEGLAKLYSNEFINCDGFNKEVYFKLVKDTWETYPNITYDTKIRNISFNEKYAKVQVYETAVATTDEVEETVSAKGELLSAANCVYYLEKVGENWLIVSEHIIDEKSILRYGDAKYINMDLLAPSIVDAGKYYTVSLKVDVPEDSVVIASIGHSKVLYPQAKTEDAFRKLPEDNILERMFLSNKDNINEYSVASIGVAKSEMVKGDNLKVYMSGLAFIMTRVNVIPTNKFIDLEAENGKIK